MWFGVKPQLDKKQSILKTGQPYADNQFTVMFYPRKLKIISLFKKLVFEI